MIYRAVKNDNGTVIAIGIDESQEGNYPAESSNEERLGVWCEWTFEEMPVLEAIEGAEQYANRYKENESQDGIELRSEEEVLEAPQG